jgi:hypothetical protein
MDKTSDVLKQQLFADVRLFEDLARQVVDAANRIGVTITAEAVRNPSGEGYIPLVTVQPMRHRREAIMAAIASEMAQEMVTSLDTRDTFRNLTNFKPDV